MGKRKPLTELIPHLRDTESVDISSKGRKRKGVVPSQTSLSVQDVRDYSTPAGAAANNEDKRRLRLALSNIEAQLEDLGSGGQQSGQSPSVGSESPDSDEQETQWAFTVKHNNTVVAPSKVIQIVNFEDNDKIKYDISSGHSSNINGLITIDDGEQINVKPIVKDNVKSGVVLINNLPLTPSPGDVIPNERRYEYEHYARTPAYGFYGWYVYALIPHNFQLTDKNNFIITLVDLHAYDDRGLDDVEALAFQSRFTTQVAYPEVEALDRNTVILRAIFKPDLSYYYMNNVIPTQAIEYINEEERIIRTNLIFRYTIYGGQ